MTLDPWDPNPELICAADIEPVTTDWLWPGWLPQGKLVLLDGNPGTGKSTLSLDVVARLSRGESFPTTDTPIRCRTAVLSTEDAADDTIRPRLDAAGAQVEMVDLWNWESPLPSFPESCDWLEAAIIERELGLVVLDQLMGFLGRGIDSHRDQDVRAGLPPLAQMAARTGATVLALRHLNKSANTAAIYRGGGSIAFAGVARVVLLAGIHPSGDGSLVLSQVKNNLAAATESLRFQLVDRNDQPTLWWVGPCGLGPDELLAASPTGGGELLRAIEWLREVLSAGPVPAADVTYLGSTDGISERTLERAKSELGVSSKKVGDHWEWSLPE